MSLDNPYEAPSAGPGKFDGGLKPLGSLTQSAIGSEIKKAQRILFVLGVLAIVFSAFFIVGAESVVDAEIQKIQRTQPGMQVTPEVRTEAINLVRMSNMATGVVGVIYILFGFVVRKFPLPITIASLVIYLGVQGFLAWLNPEAIVQGIIFKVIVVVALVKAIQSAASYNKELETEGLTA